MKRFMTAAAALSMVFAFAAAASAQITGSKHDFSSASWNTVTGEGGQICNVCHTPHNPNYSVANSDAPLWDHQVTTASYSTYATGYAMQATAGQPSGTSKLCLSCHDGTVALENFGGITNNSPTTIGTVNSAANLGTDLSNDHPVAISYGAGDPELRATNYTLTGSWVGATTTNDLLNGGNVECSSCHDVHRATGTSGKLLRATLTGSALCLGCHAK